MTAGTHTRAFAAQFRFVSQSKVDDTAFTARHGAEPEQHLALFHFFCRSLCAQTKLSNTHHAMVIGVEAEPVMVIGWDSERFHRQKFERQKQLRFIGEQEIEILAMEADHQLGVLNVGVRIITRLHLEAQIEAHRADHSAKEIFDAGAVFLNRIDAICHLPVQASYRFFFGCVTAGTGAGVGLVKVLLKNHC